MEQYEKIIELLDKNELTNDEQSYLGKIVNSDKDAARLVAVYNAIRINLPNVTHIDTNLIVDFVLYENGELSDDKVIPILADKLGLI